ncbi:MAG: trypsin-like peptidase domain-containing protein [Pseudomonadota bacterium]|nr:trypsin-like peptidase domain-containing protein [Pseudomonadota bacterium]
MDGNRPGAARPRSQRHVGIGTGALLSLFLLCLLIAGAAGGAAAWWLGARPGSEPLAELPAPVPVNAVPLSRLTLSPLVERAAPAVVNIAVLQASPLEQNPLLRDPYFRRFLGVPEEALAPRISAGSGFIVDAARGLVLTNHHVIDNAQAVEVTVGERRLPARLLGSDPSTDIAVLQIPARGLKQLPLGNSDGLKVGDYVVAIGNPFEIGQTVTAGIVSALGRGRTGGAPAYVQTDAPINPGNSGGPLISMRGEVIGINSAIIGPGEGNVGIGLAVPSNVARQVMEAIVAGSS